MAAASRHRSRLATALRHLDTTTTGGGESPPSAVPTRAAGWSAQQQPLPSPSDPIDVGATRQLFLDQRFIARQAGDISLVMHPPTQHPDPVLVSEYPWEDAGLGAYNTVLREDDGRWRMWYDAGLYQPHDTSGLPAFGSRRLCYAESADGITWTKPTLKLVPFRGSIRSTE